MFLTIDIPLKGCQLDRWKLKWFFFLFFNCNFICLLVVLDLHGCADVPLVAESGGLSAAAVCEPLAGATSPVVKRRLQGTLLSAAAARGLSSGGSRAVEQRLSSCGARVQLLHGIWDPPRPGPEPTSAATAGRFFTTELPGKPNR